MKITNNIFPLITCALLIVSCGGGSDSSDDTPIPEPIPEVIGPSATTLVFPEDNTECNEGVVNTSDDSKSTVTFEWNSSQNTDSYEINLKDLNTNTTSKSTSTTNEKAISIDRGVPYEWFVVSIANGTNETAISPIWTFYNQGEGVENYAPFPATVVSPERGSSIPSSSSIALEWTGSDVDNDIVEYEILFGTNIVPITSIGTIPETSLETNILSGEVYYWRVITKDSDNNTSNSEIFQFRVL